MRALPKQPVGDGVILKGIGHHMGYAALGGLVGGHILQPLAEEGVRPPKVAGRAAENLRVAGPAHALVALGAVGGHVQEVAPQPPFDVVFQLVDQGIGAVKMPGFPHPGMHHAGGEILRAGFAGPAFQLGVAEALEGEMLHKAFLAIAPADVADLCPGRAQVVEIGVALGVQGFKAAQMRQRALFPTDAEAHPARQVLAEVQHAFALGGAQQPCHRQLLRNADAARGLRGQRVGIAPRYMHGPPQQIRGLIPSRCLPLCRLLLAGQRTFLHGARRFGRTPAAQCGDKARRIPAGLLQIRVVILAVVDFREGHRGVAPQPAFIRDEHVLRAVLIAHGQLGQKGGMVAIVVPLQRKAHGALVPAGTHMRAQHIVPGPHKGGHVIGLIAQVMVVARPAGGQLILPNLLPVQMQVIHPQGRGAQYGAFHGPVQADFPAEVCALGIAPVPRRFRRDELSPPGPVCHAGEEEGRGRPRAFLLRRPHPDAGRVLRAGPQRDAGNLHMS